MNNIKISIIVPIYNVEKYLEKCLDSISNQNFQDIEIICVDDGSPDNSIEILNKYVSKDDRIKIVRKKNGGLGAARKTGLEHASGEYIWFVDSDDWISENSLEKLYENATSNNSDVVMFDIYRYDENTDEYVELDLNSLDKYFTNDNIDFLNFSFSLNDIRPFFLNKSFAAWMKLYKHSFLNKYDDFYFPEHLLYEDIPFHVQILTRTKRISYCPYRAYVYRLSNETSIINTSASSKKNFDIFISMDEVENYLIKNNLMEEYRNEFIHFKLQQINFWLNKIHEKFVDEFFDKSKNEIIRLNLDKHEIGGLSAHYRDIYESVIYSDTYKEMILFKQKQHLKRHIVKIEKQNKKYEIQIKKKKKLLKKFKKSKSWELTKPLRKIKKILN